eukprot:TRINITY_DN9032_c0_g1_i1.p1 TRINITY_DN9032_c0_g1~~TRINITY_DN9032_c0_g1_i1.p1  ORF type:complete len:483 (-),score=130.09 TRINITY_DN9032_c0_g1_i1:22-1392(-)
MFKRKGSIEILNPNGQPSEEPLPSENSEEFTSQNRSGLLKLLTNAVGFDVSTISVPVSVNEPASFLMRLCEQMQYSELLDRAAASDNSIERLTLISTFAISLYTVAERIGKPFNPLLGETYEYVDPQRDNFRFLGEQVSHHPPIGACHCETNSWIFWEAQNLKSKFTGNSLDCSVVGSNNVLIKATGEHFKWEAVKTTVHNIIVGNLWLDHYGDTAVVNKKTGEKANLHFKPCGWFSKGWHEVSGEICDAQGNCCVTIAGKWNEGIHAKASAKFAEKLKSSDTAEDSPLSTPNTNDKKAKKEQKAKEKKEKKERKKEQREHLKLMRKKLLMDEAIWTHTIKPLPAEKIAVKYLNDYTEHTMLIIAFPEWMKAILPPTDSRLRPDRLALEKGDVKTAGTEKYALEEKQREERRKRERAGVEWKPRWFKLAQDEDGQDFYEYLGGYWEEREKKLAAQQ